MTAPRLDKTITIGNMVSWTIVAIGLIAGYVKLQEASAQSTKDIAEIRSSTLSAKDKLEHSDSVLMHELNLMKIDIAVIKSNSMSINEKLDDLKWAVSRSKE